MLFLTYFYIPSVNKFNSFEAISIIPLYHYKRNVSIIDHLKAKRGLSQAVIDACNLLGTEYPLF